MRLERKYARVRFSEAAIRDAGTVFDETFGKPRNLEARTTRLVVDQGEDSWTFDREDEFFAAYPDVDSAVYRRGLFGDGRSEIVAWAEMTIHYLGSATTVVVETDQGYLADGAQHAILGVMRALDGHAEHCRLPQDEDGSDARSAVFIGHGRSRRWRELKDHLGDKHGYRVMAYETGARAGHTIRDTLEAMLNESTFAVLVLTKEDETADGRFRARQNVVHETGLFQGKLGFNRAVLLVEEGTEEFSNIQGIQQIRFHDIKETFGEVVATLRREFG